jgi:hypothetical protein
MSKSEVTMTEGDQTQLNVTYTPENASDKTIGWKSSDESVAKVDEYGNVTALKAGTATITATYSGDPDKAEGTLSATCVVTVEKPVVEIEVNNMGSENSGVTVTAPENGWREGENTFTVSAGKTTVVLVSNDGGQTYTKLVATETATENTYSLTVDGVTAETVITLAVVGDVNGDGIVSEDDVLVVREASLGKGSMSGIYEILGDVNGDWKISAADVLALRAISLGKLTLEW